MTKNDVGNGCGPRWMPKWMKGKTPFEDHCDLHDNAYNEGKTAEDKREADEQFLQDMLEDTASRPAPGFKDEFWRAAARSFYVLVRSPVSIISFGLNKIRFWRKD